ncbi:hypothetical protein H0H93_014461 [Arthromyces matolae]|nr:hypothetical protein H0H93_014461 [Arthromyces matolae]
MSTLPLEIYIYIIRLATWDSEGCDTSYETIETEHTETALAPILDNMPTKTSLSLVSKMFNYLTEVFLHEFIYIFRFKFVPILLAHLRRIPVGYTTPRGHFCRRLDIYLGNTRPTTYLDEAWYEGGHTLWGLVPACPYLEVLIAHVNTKTVGPLTIGTPHLTHNALWKTISSYCSQTLRRLELSGLQIRMDRIEMMLQRLPFLEVCRIANCEHFSHFDFYQDSQKQRGWSPDTYDEEEPTQRIIRTGRGPPRIFSRSDKTASGFFDQQIIEEFDKALDTAQWPPSSGTCVLPHLHTLYLDILTERFFNFNLPTLRNLGTKWSDFSQILFQTGHPVTYNYGHPNTITRTLQSQTFPRPIGNNTIFGGFPKTITRLEISDYCLPLHKLLFFFPNITHLTWVSPGEAFRIPESTMANTTLQSIVITYRCNYKSHTPQIILDGVQDALESGKLLALQEISINWKRWDPSQCPCDLNLEAFSRFGVVATKNKFPEVSRVSSFYFYP